MTNISCSEEVLSSCTNCNRRIIQGEELGYAISAGGTVVDAPSTAPLILSGRAGVPLGKNVYVISNFQDVTQNSLAKDGCLSNMASTIQMSRPA